MSECGKGSGRRGTSNEEMKRFESNYDDIFRKRPLKIKKEEEIIELCVECSTKATWVRRTQFAGDHPYCDLHAKLEKDFGQDNNCCFWQTIN